MSIDELFALSLIWLLEFASIIIDSANWYESYVSNENLSSKSVL